MSGSKPPVRRERGSWGKARVGAQVIKHVLDEMELLLQFISQV